MSENGEIYTTGKNFTLPPALTAWTNSTSGSYFGKMNSTLGSVVFLAMLYINFLLILFYCFLRFWSEVKWSVIVVEGAPPPGILGIDTWAPRQLNGSCKRGSCEGYPQPIKYTNTPRNRNTNTNWRSLWVHDGGKGELGRWEGVNVIWENWRNALLTQTQ